MPITRKEFDSGKLFWWRKVLRVLDPRLWLKKLLFDRLFIWSLRNDPEVMGTIKRSLKDYHEGKVIPWSEVKKELGIE